MCMKQYFHKSVSNWLFMNTRNKIAMTINVYNAEVLSGHLHYASRKRTKIRESPSFKRSSSLGVSSNDIICTRNTPSAYLE